MRRFWFKCAKCQSILVIDYQQVRGDSPIMCFCGLNEKGVVIPSLESKHPLSPQQTFKIATGKEAEVEKRKVGRPRKREFNGEVLANVESLAALGMDLTDIAAFMGIRRETLSRYRQRFKSFDHAIERGAAKANAKVAQQLFKNATEKNFYLAQQFWLRNRDPKNWKEKIEKQVELTDIRVKPVDAAPGVELPLDDEDDDDQP